MTSDRPPLVCERCAATFVVQRRPGPVPRYCSPACRQAAHVARSRAVAVQERSEAPGPPTVSGQDLAALRAELAAVAASLDELCAVLGDAARLAAQGRSQRGAAHLLAYLGEDEPGTRQDSSS